MTTEEQVQAARVALCELEHDLARERYRDARTAWVARCDDLMSDFWQSGGSESAAWAALRWERDALIAAHQALAVVRSMAKATQQ